MIQIAIICFLALQAAQGEQKVEPGPCESYLSTKSAGLLQECRNSAHQGLAKAQSWLGFMYGHGKGVLLDYHQAVKWYRKAAEQGEAYAQNSLGEMYREGKGLSPDYQEALKWYLKAAEQGVADSQFHLGFMYCDAMGVPQDFVRAHMWFSLAAANSKDKSKPYRDARQRVVEKMTADQIAEAQRLAREWKPKK